MPRALFEFAPGDPNPNACSDWNHLQSKKVVNFWTIFIQKQPQCQIYLLFLSPLFADNLGAHHKASTFAIFLFCLFVVLQFLSPFFCKALVFFQSAILSEVGTSKLCLHGKLENEMEIQL